MPPKNQAIKKSNQVHVIKGGFIDQIFDPVHKRFYMRYPSDYSLLSLRQSKGLGTRLVKVTITYPQEVH